MENKHVVAIPPEILAQVQNKIDEANELLAPYLSPLTPQERQELLKMGNVTFSFVVKAHDYVRHYPAFVPSYLNIAEFDTDMADAIGLRVLNTSARQLADNIDDTAMVAGSEAFQASLVFYNAVKAASAQDIPGAKDVYNDLKARFPGKKHKMDDQ
jgi:hypothetical protein